VALLVAGFLVALTLVPASSSRAQIWQPSPDRPQHWYWFRTDSGVPTRVESMDPRLQELSDTFGRGDLEGTRRLAEALLESTEDADLSAEASAYLIHSYLAEGDFEAARAAAHRLNHQDTLAYLDKLQSHCDAQVSRLESVIQTTSDPAELARAQLLTARAYERVCRFDLAETSYWKVIRQCSDRPEAGSALWRVAQLHRKRGDLQPAVEACLSAAEQFPGSAFVAATATERIAALSLMQRQNDEGGVLLLDLASSFPRTHLSAFSRHHLADLYWRTRQPGKAAGQWQALWEYEPHHADIPNLLERLAEARYRAGTEARLQGEFQNALVHLGFLSQMPQTQWRREHVLTATLLLDMAECHLGLEHWQDALDLAHGSHEVRGQPGDIPRALYVAGCAQWGLGHHTAAAEAWQTAMNDYPATEYAEESRERMRP